MLSGDVAPLASTLKGGHKTQSSTVAPLLSLGYVSDYCLNVRSETYSANAPLMSRGAVVTPPIGMLDVVDIFLQGEWCEEVQRVRTSNNDKQ